MKTRTILIAAMIMLFSCSNPPINGKGLSTIGFYSPPRSIISLLESREKGCHEHFMLGVAYKKEK